VKAGEYQIEEVILKKHSDNCIWSMRSVYGQGGETIAVNADQTTELNIGPPLTVSTEVYQRGRLVQVGLNIVGSADEAYLPYVQKDSRLLDAPKVTIMDEANNIISSGKFEYG
jgi:hypothetical protein